LTSAGYDIPKRLSEFLPLSAECIIERQSSDIKAANVLAKRSYQQHTAYFVFKLTTKILKMHPSSIFLVLGGLAIANAAPQSSVFRRQEGWSHETAL
jgi:hypothetical protein